MITSDDLFVGRRLRYTLKGSGENRLIVLSVYSDGAFDYVLYERDFKGTRLGYTDGGTMMIGSYPFLAVVDIDQQHLVSTYIPKELKCSS